MYLGLLLCDVDDRWWWWGGLLAPDNIPIPTSLDFGSITTPAQKRRQIIFGKVVCRNCHKFLISYHDVICAASSFGAAYIVLHHPFVILLVIVTCTWPL